MTYSPESSADRARLARELTARLTDAGFSRRPARTLASAEDVFEREVVVNGKSTGLSVVVFSSVVGGAVRAKDADAIRVVLEGKRRDGTTRGLRKSRRVFRTGTFEGIVDRMVDRARELYALGLRANGERCKSCGAPLFESKRENLVCLELCWLAKEKSA